MKKLMLGLSIFVISFHASGEISKEDKLRELMEIQGLNETLKTTQDQVSRQSQQVAENMLAEFKRQLGSIDEELTSEMEGAMRRFISSSSGNWSVEDATEEWITLYGKNLTSGDLDEILAYYKSTAGQKDIAATNTAVPQWSSYLQSSSQKAMDEAHRSYMDELRAIVMRHLSERK